MGKWMVVVGMVRMTKLLFLVRAVLSKVKTVAVVVSLVRAVVVAMKMAKALQVSAVVEPQGVVRVGGAEG